MLKLLFLCGQINVMSNKFEVNPLTFKKAQEKCALFVAFLFLGCQKQFERFVKPWFHSMLMQSCSKHGLKAKKYGSVFESNLRDCWLHILLRRDDEWGSICGRWRYWSRVIACCLLHWSKNYFVDQNESFFIRDKYSHLAICLPLMEPNCLIKASL